MADEDVVANVNIFVQEGVDSFDKLSEAGKQAFLSMQAEAEKFNSVLDRVTSATQKFSQSVSNVGSAAKNFGSNVGRMAASTAKYFTLLTGGLALMQKFSASQDKSADNSRELLAAAKSESQGLNQRTAATLQNAHALQELIISQQNASSDSSRSTLRQIEDINDAYMRGELTKQQAVQQTERTEREGVKARSRASADGIIAQQRLIESQEREMAVQAQQQLQRSAEEQSRIKVQEQIRRESEARRAFAENVKAFGSEMASGMVQFGAAWERLMQMFNQGPSIIADALRAAANFLNKNGQEIVDRMNAMGDAFGKLFEDGEGKSRDFGDRLMAGFRQVTDFVTNTLIPGFGKFLKILDTVAEAVNSIFGTNFSGVAILVIGILGTMTGAFRLLWSVVMALWRGFALIRVAAIAFGLTPIGATIFAIALAVGLLVAVLATLNWAAIKKAAFDAVEAIKTYFANLPGRIMADFVSFWGDVKSGFNRTVNDIKAVWDGIVAYFADLGARIVADFAASWEQFKANAQQAFINLGTYVANAIPGLNTLIALIKAGAQAWRQYNAEAAKAGDSEGATQAKAHGGSVYGPGTSTSDSIIARLSRGEFVVRAAAVRKYGTRLLHQINSMNFQGFATGGLVDLMGGASLAPAFAGGGDVRVTRASGTKRPIILQLQDGTEFQMEATGRTADAIGRYANKRRLASSGRKAGYIGS